MSTCWLTARRLQVPDDSRTIEINGSQAAIHSVLFSEDGEHVLSSGLDEMIRRWRVDDGQEVGEPIRIKGEEIYVAVLSPDRRWLACGLKCYPNSSRLSLTPDVMVWDAHTHEKVLDIRVMDHSTTITTMSAVDVSPDSTKIATGGSDKFVFIWSMATGERLVGPLPQDGLVVAVRFSPINDRIAIATAPPSPHAKESSIRIYDSGNGQRILEIPFQFNAYTSSPLAWSADSRQLFAAGSGEVKQFDSSSGTVLNKWSCNGSAAAIVLSHNQKFIVISASRSLSFWDAVTHEQIGTVIQHASVIWSIALSPNDDCVATGEQNGAVTLRSLHDVLPGSYMVVTVSDSHGNCCRISQFMGYFPYPCICE